MRNRISELEYYHLVMELNSFKEAGWYERAVTLVGYMQEEKNPRFPTTSSSMGLMKKVHFTGLPYRIRGSIKSFSEPTPVEVKIPDDSDCRSYSTEVTQAVVLEIDDGHGERINSFPISAGDLIDKVTRLNRKHANLEFYGCIIPRREKTPAGKLKRYALTFFIYDVSPADSPLDLVEARPAETAAVEKLVHDHRVNTGGILAYIKQQLVDIIGIKGLEHARELDHALDFMILQSLSDNFEINRNVSLRLHSLVMGAPAVGKKLLVEAAKILNPVFREGHPGRITGAGISGTAMVKKGAWVSTPGLIPLSHRGVFFIQDFHSEDTQVKKKIFPIFAMVMEDGIIKNSTSARQSHLALTAIHLDLNKRSDVILQDDSHQQQSGTERFDDIGIPMNILSRFDFIIDIQRNVRRQLETALAMHQESAKTVVVQKETPPSDNARILKVLIAHLRTKFAEVEIPDPILQKITKQHARLVEQNQDSLDRLNILSDFQTRLSNSMHKLVFAIARGNARKKAVSEDVDIAFKFIKTKMEFVSTIEPFATPADWGRTKSAEINARRDFIIAQYSGKEATVQEVYQHHADQYTGKQVSKDSIRRDLEEIAKKTRHGYFRIPKG